MLQILKTSSNIVTANFYVSMLLYFIIFLLFCSSAEAAGLLTANAKLYAKAAGIPDVQLGYFTLNGTTYLTATDDSPDKFNIDSATSALYGDDGRFCVVSTTNLFSFVDTPGTAQFQIVPTAEHLQLTYKRGNIYLCTSTTLGVAFLYTAIDAANPQLCKPVNLYFAAGSTTIGPINPTSPTTSPTEATEATISTETSKTTEAAENSDTADPPDEPVLSIAPLVSVDENGSRISLRTVEIVANDTANDRANEITKRDNRKAIAGLSYLVADNPDTADDSGFYIKDRMLYNADGLAAVNQDSKFITFASEGGLTGFELSENGDLYYTGEGSFYYCYLEGTDATFRVISLEDIGSCNVTSLVLEDSSDEESSTTITTVLLFTETSIITECPESVTNCPDFSIIVHTVTTTYCPDTEHGPYTITLYAAVETGEETETFTTTICETVCETLISSVQPDSQATEIPIYNNAGTLTSGVGLAIAACIIVLLLFIFEFIY
ncbi:uncharacterized protein RJT21DRAFT_112847 [Scheffersomyces amazonensis]|uniref:uncharacterized protein n=1 Tax=Scheffersomyces amazonensis TaxID=1078765 RepID=UPI00315DBDAF